MKQFLLIASVLTFVGTQVSAAFMLNRQEWNESAKLEQMGFVQGVYAEMVQRIYQESKSTRKFKKDLEDCAVSMNLTVKDLVKIVDTHYELLSNWGDPANIALRKGLALVCKLQR